MADPGQIVNQRFPASIRVAGLTYTVRLGAANDLLRAKNIAALTSFRELTIDIQTERVFACQRASVLHEILHCVTSHTNLDTAWGDHEEDYVERLENALDMVLADNPSLVRLYLVEQS